MKRKYSFRVLVSVFALLLLVASCSTPAAGPSASPSGGGSNTPSQAPGGSGTTPTQGPGSTETTPSAPNLEKTDETLVVCISGEPVRLSCLNTSPSNNDVIVGDLLWAPLFQINYSNMEFGPGLATHYDEIDETHYRIFLRKDACFEDGTPVTAEDCVWTLKQYASTGAVQFANYLDADGIIVEDEHTFVIAYKTFTTGWQYGLTREGMHSEAMVEAAGGLEAMDKNPGMTCGRYKFTEWVTGQYILCERNENYWDENYVGYYKYIKFIFVGDVTSRLMAVQSGDANVALSLPMSMVLPLENDPNVDPAYTSFPGFHNLVFYNVSEGPFADPKLREAVNYMIDANAMLAVVNMGYGKLVQGYFEPPENPYYFEYYPGGVHPFDPEKGKQLMAEAGYTDTVSVYLPCLPTAEALAVIVKENLRAANIDVQIEVLDTSVNVQYLRNGNYDMHIATAGYPGMSADIFERLNPNFVGRVNGGCRTSDPALTELINKARSSDPVKAKEGVKETMTYVYENNLIRGLMTNFDCHVVSKGLDGLRPLSRAAQISLAYLSPAA